MDRLRQQGKLLLSFSKHSKREQAGNFTLNLKSISITTRSTCGAATFLLCESCTEFDLRATCLHVTFLQKIMAVRDHLSPSLRAWIDSGRHLSAADQHVVSLGAQVSGREQFAVFLTLDEAERNDCHTATVCMVKHQRKLAVVTCSSGRCAKRRFSEWRKKSEPPALCAHVKVLTKFLERNVSDGWAHSSSDSNCDSSAPDERMEVTQGLGFSSVSNQWVPAPDCSQSLIPVRLALTTTQLAIIEDRVTFSCIEREEGSLRPKKDINGNYIGHACHPTSCNRCNEVFPLSSVLEPLGEISILTANGAIVRKRYAIVCVNCDVASEWDPSTELVHTIKGGKFGGEFKYILFMLICVICFSGGYELIYAYLEHLFGSKAKYGGVPMHMGHMYGHLVLGSFGVQRATGWSQKLFQRFLQSGVALWMASHPRVVPCCDIPLVGGDGTSIGISLRNLLDLKPVWMPSEKPDPVFSLDCDYENRRMGRISIRLHGAAPIELTSARRLIRNVLTEGVTTSERNKIIAEWNNRIHKFVPVAFQEAFDYWDTKVDDGPFKKSFRKLLRDCIAECSACYQVPKVLIVPLKTFCFDIIQPDANRSECILRLRAQFPLYDEGILFPAVKALSDCTESWEATNKICALLGLMSEFLRK